MSLIDIQVVINSDFSQQMVCSECQAVLFKPDFVVIQADVIGSILNPKPNPALHWGCYFNQIGVD